MIIREANKKDSALWVQMRTQLWPETRDQHSQEVDEYFSGHSIDIVKAYVVEADSELVGFLELNIRNFAEGSRQSQVPYIEAWYIKPNYRNKGYGRQLMHRAEEWAIAKGYTELASDTEIYNTHSITLHKHLGFAETERVVCFLKKLQGK